MTWTLNTISSLSIPESQSTLHQRIEGLARELGFDYWAYGIRLPVPISRPSVAMFSNYGEKWHLHYEKQNYLNVDPTVQHALRSTLPILWSESLFREGPKLWEDARANGLQFGWAQAARDAHGAVGLLTLARGAEPITENELKANEPKMIWLTQIVHAQFGDSLVLKLAPELAARLTVREKEVLCWTAEGKTAFEISQILNLSERTVNFHIGNVVRKMGAVNKIQASVRAGILGLLD